MHKSQNLQATKKAISQKKSTTKPHSKMQMKKKTLNTTKRNMSNKKLTVILSQDQEDLGKAGDLVALKPGRARNHLFPKGLAMYDTPENRAVLNKKGIEVQDFVIDKEAELKAASTRTYPAVQGDVIRNMGWNFNREPITSADNHVRKPITKRDVLARLRLSKFFYVEEQDIEFPQGYEVLDHCGVWPCAVAIHSADASEYQLFNVNVNRVDIQHSKEEDAAAV